MVTDLLLVSVGNSRTRIAHGRVKPDGTRGDLEPAVVVENTDPDAALAAAVRVIDRLESESARILLASVTDPVADPLAERLAAVPAAPRLVRLVSAAGQGLKVPIVAEVENPAAVGVDRLLTALAASDRTQGDCVVVDAGTAVTVDFVDRHGIFQGGVIAPGLGAMLRAMHQTTAKLPLLAPPGRLVDGHAAAAPRGPLGKNTSEAMLLGASRAIVGLVHDRLNAYAELAGGYPRIIATGGDAGLLFEHDDLVEHIIPDLLLMGMQAAWIRAAAEA